MHFALGLVSRLKSETCSTRWVLVRTSTIRQLLVMTRNTYEVHDSKRCASKLRGDTGRYVLRAYKLTDRVVHLIVYLFVILLVSFLVRPLLYS